MEGPMTNDPRNPLPGQQPGGTPQNPEQGSEMGSEQTSGSGQPGMRDTTPTTGASSTGRSAPASSSSEQRTGQAPQATRTTTQTQTSQPRQATPTRTYEAPRKNNNKKFALFGILGLLAVGGIITGFAVSGSSTPTVPTAIRPLPGHARHLPASTSTLHRVAFVNGTGVSASKPFKVTGPVTANYSFRCSTGSHPFTAALAQSRAKVLPFVSTTGTGRTGSVSVPGAKVGSTYFLGASSACPYHVSVYER
jgi:hypothetical protein